MDRLLNYIFLLLLIYIFALWAPASIHSTIALGLAIAFLFSAIAFVFKWLSLDGAAAATVIGAVTFGLGGWPTIIALLFFFLSSSLFSIKESGKTKPQNRRSGRQVWANGFWVVLWLIIGMLANSSVFWMAALAALATATADTWATELGSRRFNVTTYRAFSFAPVAAGTEGGISWAGLIASVAGSGIIAAIAWIGFSSSTTWFTFIIFAGLAGSLLDSYLGATIQGTKKQIKLPRFIGKKEFIINNNAVNWIATGAGSLLVLILNLVFI